MGGSEPTLIGWCWSAIVCLVMLQFVGGIGRCCGDGSVQPRLVCKILCSPFKPFMVCSCPS